jgi:type VI secretion system protein ImpA
VLDPAVAALCAPLPGEDPCGPNLDLADDAGYLNFFAQVEGVLPPSFFSAEDGRPFDRTKVDLGGQLEAVKPLLARTRDLRLLTMQARLQILNKDLAGFAVSVAAVAQCLEAFWDEVHPRSQDGDWAARSMAIAALDDPRTVILPLQYAPLFEVPRIGAIAYRGLMIANGEVKARGGEQKLSIDVIMNARGDANPATLAAIRGSVATTKAALDRIRNAFVMHGTSAGLENVVALVGKIQSFVDPAASAAADTTAESAAAA